MDWLNNIFKQIECKLDEETTTELARQDAAALCRYHFTLGVWIRNSFFQKDSIAYRALMQAGIHHRDDMSAFILTEFHSYLHNR